MQDSDAFLFHYYLQKGIPLSELKTLSYSDRVFMLASIELQSEIEQKKADALQV